MSIRPPPFPKHNLREGIIKSWEYLLLKAPPEWQFGIPILKKLGHLSDILCGMFRTAYYVKYSNCSFQKLCSKLPEPYSFHHSWGSWFCSLLVHGWSNTEVLGPVGPWFGPRRQHGVNLQRSLHWLKWRWRVSANSFLDDRAIGTTEPWSWEDLNRWRRELPDTKLFFLHILFPDFWFDDFSIFAGYVSVPWRVYFGCGPIPVGRWLKWRFCLGFPTEPVIIMVVTVTGREPRPT